MADTSFLEPVNFPESFRCTAKNFFLTYDKCPLEKSRMLELLLLNTHADFDGYCISREKHKDGQFHLHVYLRFPNKKNIRSDKAFDVKEGVKNYHCNIQACRGVKNVLSYIQKDDTAPLTNLTQDELRGLSPWEIIHKSHSSEFLEAVGKFDPRALYVSHSNIMSAYEWKKSKEQNPVSYESKWSITDYKTPQELLRWRHQIGRKTRCILLIILGPPNTGKTSMVRSIGKHVYIRNMWNMKKFINTDYEYVVLDDMELSSFNPLFYRSILLGDGEQDCSDKYMKKHTIVSHGKPCVLISNHEEILDKFSGPAWNGCYEVLRVTQPLYQQDNLSLF